MSQAELEEMKTLVEDNLAKGFIQASFSPAETQIHFIKNADNGLRLCVDYQRLNKEIITNCYQLLVI